MFPFHLVESVNAEILLMETHHPVLSGFKIKTKKNQYTILKTCPKKNLPQSLTRFHDELFE